MSSTSELILKNNIVNDNNKNLETRRWFILTIFCVNTFMNASAFVTFSPILKQAETYYNVSEQEILWLANTFYLVYATLAIPTLFFFRWRLDVSLIMGTCLNSVGGWLRYIGDDKYEYVLSG